MRENVWLRAWLVGTLVLFVMAAGIAASLTPYAYVELTKQTMERKVQDLNQLIAEISSFSGDAEAWISTEAQLNAAFDAQHEVLCASYGVTAEEYVLFFAANEADVESYLDTHPEDGSYIEYLEAQISASLDQYEQLKINLLQLGPVVPEEPLPPGV